MPETTSVQDSGAPPASEAAATPPQETSPAMTEDTVRKMIQSETDKVRTKYSQELAAKSAQIEELQKEKMSESQRKKFEEDKLRDELSQKAAALALREQTLKAIDLLKEKGIPDRFRPFVIGKDDAETAAKVEILKTEWQAAIKEAVEGRFKDIASKSQPGKPEAAPTSGKIYTRAEIAEMGRKAMDRNTSPADRAAINAEMQAAQREGRIKFIS